MNQSLTTAALFLLATLASIHAAEDCQSVYFNTKKRVAEAPDYSVEIAAAAIAASASCGCEIVKASIEASQADPTTVAAIVEAAILIAPQQMRPIAQCAIAVAPDALSEIQAVLARVDPNSGESRTSAKDSKSVKDSVASMWNPLDFPGVGPVGPPSGVLGVFPFNPDQPPSVISLPAVTNVDP